MKSENRRSLCFLLDYWCSIIDPIVPSFCSSFRLKTLLYLVGWIHGLVSRWDIPAKENCSSLGKQLCIFSQKRGKPFQMALKSSVSYSAGIFARSRAECSRHVLDAFCIDAKNHGLRKTWWLVRILLAVFHASSLIPCSARFFVLYLWRTSSTMGLSEFSGAFPRGRKANISHFLLK